MDFILSVQALAGISVTVPCNAFPRGGGGSPFPQRFYARYAYLLLTVLNILWVFLTFTWSRSSVVDTRILK